MLMFLLLEEAYIKIIFITALINVFLDKNFIKFSILKFITDLEIKQNLKKFSLNNNKNVHY